MKQEPKLKRCRHCDRVYRFKHKCQGGRHQVRADVRGYHWQQLARTRWFVMAQRPHDAAPQIIGSDVWRSWRLVKP